MMKFLSRSDDVGAEQKRSGAVEKSSVYESVIRLESQSIPNVKFDINRVSFGRRTELAKRVRAMSQRAQFLEAGEGLQEKLEANILAREIESTYLRWGLVRIDGLLIDGQPATTELLIDKGPEELAKEIVKAIKSECGLSAAERKN